MTKQLDLEDFARRVERLCDFLLARVSEENGRDGSADLRVIEDLKAEAADIQFNRVKVLSGQLQGLADFMKGSGGA